MTFKFIIVSKLHDCILILFDRTILLKCKKISFNVEFLIFEIPSFLDVCSKFEIVMEL